MNFKVVNAKSINLDTQAMQKISEITLEDENLGYRPLNIVRNSIDKGFFLVALDESNKLLGWIEKYKIWKDWWGLSTLYVFPEYRDTNIGRGALIPNGIKQLKGKNIFAATTNKNIQPVLEELGFKNVNLSELPFMVKINLMLMRYLNIRGLIKLLKLRGKGLNYFIRFTK